MTQMTAVWQVKTHQSVMRPHDSLVDLEICRAATQALNIDSPFLRVQIEGFESTSLTGQFNGVNVLISTIIPCTWVTLGVFVGHW